MVAMFYTSTPAPQQSDTPAPSASSYISSLVSPIASQLHDITFNPLAPSQIHSETSSASLLSLVRRKPLPPTASHLATRYSSNGLQEPKIELPPQVPEVRSLASNVSTSNEDISLSWESANFISASQENYVPLSLSTKFYQQRNTLPSQTSPSLSATKPFMPAPTLSMHRKMTSSTSMPVSEMTRTWSNNPTPSTTTKFPMSSSVSTLASHKNPEDTKAICLASSNETNNCNSRTSGPSMTPQSSNISSFLSWRDNITSTPSASTVSENSYSPISSPPSCKQDRRNSDYFLHQKLSAIDVMKSNSQDQKQYQHKLPQIPLLTPISPPYVDNLEKELREISTELAASIKREIELEDVVERLKAEVHLLSDADKLLSEYVSKCDGSALRTGVTSDSKQEDIDSLTRKNEHSKAQMRVEYTMTIQDERARRNLLEMKIEELEAKVPHINQTPISCPDINGRIRELEISCEDHRRRLAEEQQQNKEVNDNLSMLKIQLQQSLDERDNLRDEIVPQLRARVEGLEAQAAEHEKLTYEQTKVQHELQALRGDNMAIINDKRMNMKPHNQSKRLDVISEGNGFPATRKRRSFSQGTDVTTFSSQRSITLKPTETRDALAERVKDIELQRDSLHIALKSLLERQEHQNRENQKTIKQLELELERAISISPQRFGYEKEIKNLRCEINVLRVRADDAIRQKLHSEKSLADVKMNLNHAEQEIKSLRKLIGSEKQNYDASECRLNGGVIIPETLESSYKDLQTTFSEYLEQIKSLRSEPMSEETTLTLERIEQILIILTSERHVATFKTDSLKTPEKSSEDVENVLIDDKTTVSNKLFDSAKILDEMIAQVRQQIDFNSKFRQRFASVIEYEEKEQAAEIQRICALQSQLNSLQEEILYTQNSTEERLISHEEAIKEMKENQIAQLQRIKEKIRSPLSPTIPKSIRSPKKIHISGSAAEHLQIEKLRQKITELERALNNADKEMETVINRMSASQIKVMELQNERDKAVRETKRLQSLIVSEKSHADLRTWTSLLMTIKN